MPAWQLNTIGVEAVVFLSAARIWSKQSSAGAVSWLTGILIALILSTWKYNCHVNEIIICIT